MHARLATSAWAVVALLVMGGVWFIGHLTNLLWLQQVAFVAMFPGLIWAIMGGEIVKILAWPLGFLVFMLPVGTSIEPWLQDFTAWFARTGLDITNVPYLADGYQIVITTGTWDVARDCGGLRYLLPGLALGYAFATLIYRQPIRRVLFLGLCTFALMVANGLRAYGVIIGDHFGIADGADHRIFSYTIYGVTMPLLVWIGLKWQERMTLGTMPPGNSAPRREDFDARKTFMMAVAAITVLAIAPLAVRLGIGS